MRWLAISGWPKISVDFQNLGHDFSVTIFRRRSISVTILRNRDRPRSRFYSKVVTTVTVVTDGDLLSLSVVVTTEPVLSLHSLW